MKNVVRPSERYQINLGLSWLLVIGVGLMPFALLGLVPDLGWVWALVWMGGCIVVLLAALVTIPFYCRTILYEIGEHQVVVRKGIITQSTKTVPYNRITNLELKRGPFDRILGTGTIALHTAGYSQQGGPEAVLAGLADHQGLHQTLLALIEAQGGHDDGTAGSEIDQDQAYLRDLLAELRALRKDVTFKRGD